MAIFISRKSNGKAKKKYNLLSIKSNQILFAFRQCHLFHHPCFPYYSLYTSMPPTQPTPTNSANLRYRTPLQQLVTLAKTQQFYWFLGHVFAVLFFILSTLTGFWNRHSSLKYYRCSLLSIILTYLIVIRQIHFKSTFKLSSINIRLLRDENVQYLLLAVVFYVSSFIIGQTGSSLYSFAIFAVFHVLTYFQNHLLSVFIGDIATQSRISSMISNFTSKFNQPALIAASNAEIVLLVVSGFQLIPSALLLLFRRNIVEVSVQVLVFVAIVVFNKFRFDSNQYTKVVVEQMDLKVNQTLAQINSPQLSQLYQNARAGALKYLSLIKLPKESGKKK